MCYLSLYRVNYHYRLHSNECDRACKNFKKSTEKISRRWIREALQASLSNIFRSSQCSWVCSHWNNFACGTCVSRLRKCFVICKEQRSRGAIIIGVRDCVLITRSIPPDIGDISLYRNLAFGAIIPIGSRGGCPTRNPVTACQIRPRINPITALDGMPIASQELQPNRCCVYVCPPPPSHSHGIEIRANLFPLCVLTPVPTSNRALTLRPLTFDRGTTIEP